MYIYIIITIIIILNALFEMNAAEVQLFSICQKWSEI